MQSICSLGCNSPAYVEKRTPQTVMKSVIAITAIVSAIFIGLAAAGLITAISASLAAISGTIDLLLLALHCKLKMSKRKVPKLPVIKPQSPISTTSPPVITKVLQLKLRQWSSQNGTNGLKCPLFRLQN